MLKNIFFVFLVLFISTVTYTQEAGTVNKNLTFYICGGTENINPQAGSILGGWSEMGLTFSQNFANVPWFSVATTAAICGEIKPLLQNTGGDYVGSLSPDFSITGYGKVNLMFDRYFALGFATVGRIDLDLRYRIALSANQRLTLRTYMELFPTGNSWYATLRKDSPLDEGGNPLKTRQVLGHMDYRITYYVQFHPEWGYESDVRFRFNGKAQTGQRADSIQAVRDSFSIRWNNTFYYSNPNGFGSYFQFRYQPNAIALKTKHSMQLNAGLTYSYDLSGL
ncbi:MAG: hypothetical protein ACRC0X_01445 [Brevinema sp.]